MQTLEKIVSDSKNGYTLEGTVIILDNNDVIVVVGGGRDHIGAISLIVHQPGPDEQTKTTTSILTRPGHRDDEPAKQVGEQIAAATGRNTAVIAGIHYDSLTFSDLEILRQLWVSLSDKIIILIKQQSLSRL
ncbi:MAG: hypothetical protein JXR80_02530 [Deltaproteobacteria bacterium]|nr:hypothetical protein [Deltaproteobacteria bacterium]